jgi:HTH-type transcriptional regulator/antitoxin HigA
MNARLDVAMAHWGYITPLLTPPATEHEYQTLVESLDAVLDAGGADESHHLAGLAAMLGELIAVYEQANYPMPAAMSGIEALRFFMERDGLRQSDLPEIGNQAKVSEILSGKRALNLRQVRSLAARFGVPWMLLAE